MVKQGYLKDKGQARVKHGSSKGTSSTRVKHVKGRLGKLKLLFIQRLKCVIFSFCFSSTIKDKGQAWTTSRTRN